LSVCQRKDEQIELDDLADCVHAVCLEEHSVGSVWNGIGVGAAPHPFHFNLPRRGNVAAALRRGVQWR